MGNTVQHDNYMNSDVIKVLLLEDNPEDVDLVQEMLSEAKGESFDLEYVDRLSAGLKRLARGGIDIVLLDISLPDSFGLDTFNSVDNQAPEVPIVVISGSIDEGLAIKAVKKGAQDFLIKGHVDKDLLVRSIRYAIERKRASEELRKFSHAIQHSAHAVVITNTEGNIEYVNPKFVQITGYTSEEVIGKDQRTFLGEITHEEYKRLRDNVMSGKEWHGKLCNKKKNGVLYWESTSVSPVRNSKGVITHFVVLKEDITERKKMEEKLRISSKMASIGRLTAGIFHEVLNPINIISSHVQLLLMDAEKGSKTEEDLKSIQEEIMRVVKITDGLLRYSRARKREVDETDINSLLKKTISIVESALKLDNINFIRKFEAKLPKIMASSDELRQVFLNLITNAGNAMPDGGMLTVKTRSVRQAGELKGDFVEISFADTGCGIASEDIDKIFEPFFTTKKEGDGVGLGLSMLYTIIENHRGTISVKSKVGKGTTFTIDLPC